MTGQSYQQALRQIILNPKSNARVALKDLVEEQMREKNVVQLILTNQEYDTVSRQLPFDR